MESMRSLLAILAKSARTDKARGKKSEVKLKSNRVELQYPKIMVPLPRVDSGANFKKNEDGVEADEDGGGKEDERLVKEGGGKAKEAEVERKRSAETVSLRSRSDGGSIVSL